jgi:peptidyl-prolyl cis-trans isomerase A (cyclophilin A)
MPKRQGSTLRARSAASLIIGALLTLCAGVIRAQDAARPDAPTPAVAAPAVAAPAAAAPAAAAPAAAAPIRVLLHLQAGDIVIALDAEHAPLTTANFLRYVDQKRYDGARFYRAVKIDDAGQYGLLQGGLRGGRVQEFKPIAHESPAVTGLHHVDGAVSMARNAPGTATSEFFIVIGDLSSLDGGPDDPGYAVFGHVESGMPLVHDLLALPRSADAGDGSMSGQILAEPVKILTVRRLAPSAVPDKAP